MGFIGESLVPGRNRSILWLLGSCSCLIYGVVLALSAQFPFGEGHQERPILAVLALLGAATLVYFLALGCVFQQRRNASESLDQERSDDRHTLRVVWFFAIAYRLILLPSAPIQEIDFYRYLWDGQLVAHGFNPYHFSPAQLDRWSSAAPPGSDLFGQGELSRSSETVTSIFQRVHHREVPTVYPPAAQWVFAAAAALTPGNASCWTHILVLKVGFVALDLGTMLVLVGLLRRLQMPTSWCLAYGWCPLAIKEVANSGHLDVVAVFFTTLALYLLVSNRSATKEQDRPALAATLAAGLALGLAVLAKSYPIILLPVVGAFLLVRFGGRALLVLGVFAATVVLGYLPFLDVFSSPAPAAASARAPIDSDPDDGRIALPLPTPQSSHPWTGLATFLGRWQMNDFLFMIVHENLRRPGAAPDLWFVLLPKSWREQLDDGTRAAFQDHPWPPGIDPAFVTTQLVMGAILLGLTAIWAWRVSRQPEPAELLRAAFLTLAWGWLLSSAQNPWYLLWCLPLMVFDGRRSWFLLTGLVLLYYLRFWLEYRAGDSAADATAAQSLFDFHLVWLEYVPFFLALLAETITKGRNQEDPKTDHGLHGSHG
jgi:hypothetical protein